MRTWTTPEGLVFEEEQTGDGRLFVAGSLTWEDPANGWPLRYDAEDDGGHAGAVLVGAIGDMERIGSAITSTGTLDDDDPVGGDVARRLDEDAPLGVSVDLDDMEVEFVLSDPEEIEDEAVLLAAALPLGRVLRRADGVQGIQAPRLASLVAAAGLSSQIAGLVAAAGDGEPEDGIILWTDAMDAIVMRVTRARIRGATLVDIPAFDRARIVLDPPDAAAAPAETEGEAAADGAEAAADTDAPCLPCLAEELAVVAAAAPHRPPRAWFADPGLSAPTPMIYEDDGRVYGHIALWGQCHTGGGDACILTPRSRSNYSWFRQGYVRTAEGDDLPVGAMTIGGGHADPMLSFRGALAHYDDAATRFADVTAGEDSHGVWVAGALRPGVARNEERMREVRAAPPSGDWRWIDGGLELVLAHSVNSGGFPVPRAAVAASGGHLQSLVAAGARELAFAGRARRPGPRLDADVISEAVEAGITRFLERQAAQAARDARARLRRVDPARRRALARLRG